MRSLDRLGQRIEERLDRADIREAEEYILTTVKREASRNSNVTLGQVANVLWEGINSRFPLEDEFPSSPKYTKRQAFVRAMHLFSVSISSTKPAREHKYFAKALSD